MNIFKIKLYSSNYYQIFRLVLFQQQRGRAQGASGRFHRTQSGDWVWSSDDEADKDQDQVI